MKKTLLLLFFTGISFAQTGILTPVDRLRIKTPQELSGNTQVITRGTATGETGYVLKSDLTDILKYANALAFPLTGLVGKIYYAIDTDLYYKWDGATYEEFGGGGTIPTLQQVLDIGNSASSSVSPNDSSVGFLTDSGTVVEMYLQKTDTDDASRFYMDNVGGLTLQKRVLGNETILSFETPTSNTQLNLPAKGAGTYTLATIDDITGGSATIVTKTKSEIDTLISGNDLVPLTVYEITGVDATLYGGSAIYLQAITDKTLSVDGVGKFYNPKYNQSVSGFDVWTSSGTYAIGDKVHWGGKTWTNVNGNVGSSTDIFTLDAEWSVIAFNSTDYNVVYDAIKYDYTNDAIVYRNEQNSNIVSTSFSNIDDLNANPIKSFMWGNLLDSSVYVGIGYQTINNSYNENINFTGAYQTYINLNSYSQQTNVNFKNGSYQQDIFMYGSYQNNLTFDNGSSQSLINLINSSYQNNLTFDNGSEQQRLFLNNNSSQRNLTFDNNSSQRNLTFDNDSSQRNLTAILGFDQYNITFNNYSFDRTSSSMTTNEDGLVFQGDLPISTTATKMIVKEGNQLKEMDIPSGSGSTNLSTTYTASDITIVSSSGTDATVNAVDGTNAGVVTPTQKSTWDGKQDALGFTPYNATNPSGYQTASQVTTAISSRISNEPYSSSWNDITSETASLDILYEQFEIVQDQLNNKQPLSSVLTATTASFTTADKTKLDKYPSTATNGKILQGDGTNYVEVDAPTSPTTIVGITGTKAQYDTSVTDGNFMYVGDAPTAHTHTSSDITDFNSATRAQVEAELVAGSNITITPSGTGATRQLTIASTGGSTSGSGTYSETPTWSNTAPTTLLANNFEWIEQNKVVNLRISLSYNVAASNTSVRLPLPSGSPVPKSITGFTGASNIQTFGSGLMFIDIDALPASAGRSCFLRRNPANNGYEVVVQHSAAISLKNVIANITYISE